jgi:hypothetical protein
MGGRMWRRSGGEKNVAKWEMDGGDWQVRWRETAAAAAGGDVNQQHLGEELTALLAGTLAKGGGANTTRLPFELTKLVKQAS